MLGREPAIKGAESPDEDDEALRGAGLPRASVGGPGSSGSAEAAPDRPGASPGVICACGVLSPSLAAARRIRGRSGSSPLPEEDEPEEELDAVLDVLSPSLEAALCSRGRSGSLSSELLARDTDPDPDPSIGCDASARSSAVPCLNCVTFTARYASLLLSCVASTSM